MAGVDEQQKLAAELRRLADLVEQHPPSKVDFDFRRPLPVEVEGEFIHRDGYEYLKAEVHW